MKVGVIIGRFQLHFLHQGHLALINNVRTKCDQLLILLGVSPWVNTPRDPLPYVIRSTMIKNLYPDVITLPLKDMENDEEWSKNVDRTVAILYPHDNITLYAGRNSFKSRYSGRFPVLEIKGIAEDSATKHREEIKMESESLFTRGVIHGIVQNRNRIIPTVDIGFVDINVYNSKGKILLGRKDEETTWRLPGGVVDPLDESYEAAARRELFEETGFSIEGPMKYLGSFSIEDWRIRGSGFHIKTSLFMTSFLFGFPKPGDDMVELQWFSFLDTELDEIVRKEHKPLLEAIRKEIDKKDE